MKRAGKGKVMDAEKRSMGKREQWNTCIHEAGHVVLRWNHWMDPVRVEIYDSPKGDILGFTHGDGKAYGIMDYLTMTAGGIAAELRKKRASKFVRLLLYRRWFDAFLDGKAVSPDMVDLATFGTGCDAAEVGQKKEFFYQFFTLSLETAHAVVNRNWEKVLQVAGLLKQDRVIPKRAVARLFAEWRKGGRK